MVCRPRPQDARFDKYYASEAAAYHGFIGFPGVPPLRPLGWGPEAAAPPGQARTQQTRPLLPQPLAPAARGDSLDWKDYDASTIAKRVTSKVSPGSIVLFHNAALHTPEALPDILEYLLREGYHVVPVSRLILPGTCGSDYSIDHTGRQIPAA